ncbi:MAG: D-glycero-beta-D-manno-heptose-7-phosphate kinase [Armatimonadota bacterium]|nr:D-glycero-beta-D-manno-heptose-7-phosphate kinase [Armatimonadota bacterium]
MNASRISELLSAFENKRVLVVGDLMLDEYVWGAVSRISPEAPVMVIEVNGDSDFRPGGAANVVHNVQTLGAIAGLVGVVGDDSHGRRLKQQLTDAGVDVNGVVIDRSRPTTRKTRIIAHNQQVVRVDREKVQDVSTAIARKMMARLEEQIPQCDAVLFSDYNKGAITSELVGEAISISRNHGRVVTSNPKPMSILKFKGATVVTLNQSEAQAAVQRKLENEDQVRDAGLTLVEYLSADAVIITRGAHGLCVCERNGKTSLIPAMPIEVYDVAGAGDTVISALTLALTAGADFVEAATIANWAGAAAVTKVGVAAVTRDEIAQVAKRLAP